MRACTLDGVHDATALEQLIESDAAENLLGPFLEEAGEEIAREKDYKCADQCRHILIKLREAFLKPFAEALRGVSHCLLLMKCGR